MSIYRTEIFPADDWTLPNQQPAVLIAQLRADLVHDSATGCLRQKSSPRYRTRLTAAFDQALAQNAQFLVFPEYAWPFSLRDQLVSELDRLPRGCVCVAPFEHLTLAELDTLLDQIPGDRSVLKAYRAHLVEGLSEELQATAFFNLAFSFVRSEKGFATAPQAKLRAAALEERRANEPFHLSGGTKRWVVRGANCSFTVAICFDLIARDDAHGANVRDAIAEDRSWQLLVVPECNPAPFHEAYTKAIVDLYQHPQVAPRKPSVLLANVARRSRLQGLRQEGTCFGFSRVIGNLGNVTPDAVEMHVTVADHLPEGEPASLQQLHRGTPLRGFGCAVARPHESLVRIKLPTLTWGPSADPTTGRTHTELGVFRFVDEPPQGNRRSRWHPVHPLFALPAAPVDYSIPRDLVFEEGLVGADGYREQFERLLRSSSEPVWVLGTGGMGKTALVANTLHAVAKDGDIRVIWVDARNLVPAKSEVMLEELLVLLGKGSALAQSTAQQWRVVQRELLRRATVLVLDDFDTWVDDASLWTELSQQHAWPCRLVVTTREDLRFDAPYLRLAALSRDASKALMERVARRPLDAGLVEALYAHLEGSPLACVWVGGLLRAGDVGHTELSTALNSRTIEKVEGVFQWCLRTLSPNDQEVLGLLCVVVGGISEEDIGAILALTTEEVHASIRRLRRLNLAMFHASGPTSDALLHMRHPFVKEYWDASRSRSSWDRLLAWSRALVEEHGGDRNWAGIPALATRWPTIRPVLHTLAASVDVQAKEQFLAIWRLVDYFLWASGRWRERAVFGGMALELAQDLGKRELVAYALADSLAETEWHRRQKPELFADLLQEAYGILIDLRKWEDAARVEYHRSRLFRRLRRSDEALHAAEQSYELAQRARSDRGKGLAMYAKGYVLASMGRFDAARSAYAEARSLLGTAGDREMVAVVRRSIGRALIEEGHYSRAAVELESAFDEFRSMGLLVKAAEAGLSHAQALAGLGERHEAERELENVSAALAALGSLREDEVEHARRAIEELSAEPARA